jgi:hypothetical protein
LDLGLPALPVPRTARSDHALARWLRSDPRHAREALGEKREPWYRVLWLTGVDYFSTLGYQPGIALLAAGALSPIATAVLVVVTLLGAVPVYAEVARHSFAGQGSIAMLETLLAGWRGKVFVLALLGFAATDFVITITLSAADATVHAIENPILNPWLGDSRMLSTIILLALLACVFLKGFKEAVRIAIAIAVPYMLLNLVVLARGLYAIVERPELREAWRGDLTLRGDWPMLLLAAGILFPKLALGMSGFETGVAVMPHVSGDAADEGAAIPTGRIRATRRLLLAAALIMSVMLILSSFVTTILIPPEAYGPQGQAAGRALAYLAHEELGEVFGSIYDLWTIAILWFAGASAMAGLLNLIPRYLPRFGMAPQWTSHRRPMVLVIFAVSLLVTWIFEADVEAQGGAYATGVLVLMLSAAFAVALVLWRESRAEKPSIKKCGKLTKSLYFWIVTGVFTFTLVDNVIGRPEGVVIATCFVVTILVLGAVSRIRRATELRVSEMRFADVESARLWQGLVGKKVNLVPLSGSSAAARARKGAELRKHYALEGQAAFLHVNLMDNRSEFLAPLTLKITRSGQDVVMEVYGAIAVANTIAYISELLDPISLFLGLTGQNLMSQAMRYLLWGEGEVGLMVYKILLRYWEWTPGDDDVRPRIFLMSE